jgi:hypothetical protein
MIDITMMLYATSHILNHCLTISWSSGKYTQFIICTA